MRFDDAMVHALLGDQFQDRLKEVDVPAPVLVDILEQQGLGLGIQTILTD